MFIVDRLLKLTHLKWIDRLLGALFGLVRGWLVCAVIVLAMTAFAWQVPRLEASALAPYLLMTARAVALVVPTSVRRGFEATYRAIYRHWLDGMKGYRPGDEAAPEQREKEKSPS
jgi:membrane protein required for colicin V production